MPARSDAAKTTTQQPRRPMSQTGAESCWGWQHSYTLAGAAPIRFPNRGASRAAALSDPPSLQPQASLETQQPQPVADLRGCGCRLHPGETAPSCRFGRRRAAHGRPLAPGGCKSRPLVAPGDETDIVPKKPELGLPAPGSGQPCCAVKSGSARTARSA
jgi:hypothetical protein